MSLLPKWSTPQEIENDVPVVRQLRLYWESLNHGEAPERNLIDPIEIKELLPYMLLVEFETAPFRVKYRLTGTKIDEVTGYNLTGRYLDEFRLEPYKIAGASNSQLHSAYERVWRTGRPVIDAYLWTDRPITLMMPFGIFPVTVNGEITQGIAIEQIFRPTELHEIRTWKDYVTGQVTDDLPSLVSGKLD